jgi:hypothetical protein
MFSTIGFLKSESEWSASIKFYNKKSTVLHKVSGVLTYSGVSGFYSSLKQRTMFSLIGLNSYW